MKKISVQVQSVLYHNEKKDLMKAIENINNALRIYSRENEEIECWINYGDASKNPIFSDKDIRDIEKKCPFIKEIKYTFFEENTGTAKGHNRLGEKMENQIKYVRVSAENGDSSKLLALLLHEYIREMNAHSERPLPEQFVQKWCDSILSMQGPADRYLELCYAAEILVGFLYGKIDHEDHNGFIKPGCGYVMEFYVRPEYRRKGYGRMMFRQLEQMFRYGGAKMMYLTADPVTGKPFWEAMGFVNTGEQ